MSKSSGLSLLLFGITCALSGTAMAAKRAIIVHGDGQQSAAADPLENILLARGFAVTRTGSVPSDLSSYCCAYDIRPFEDLSDSDRTRYSAFLQDGHGLLVFGENLLCCTNRNATITSFIRDTLGGGDVLVSSTDEVLGTFSEAASGHSVNNTPRSVRNVTYNGRGAGVWEKLGRGTFLTSSPPYPDKVAAVWDETRLTRAPQGRLISTLDINWLIETLSDTDNQEFAENISHFLCPATDLNLEVEITSPASFTKECPDPVTIAGVVRGVDEDCVQPTTLTIDPAPARSAEVRLDRVQRGGPTGDGDPGLEVMGEVARYGETWPDTIDSGLAALTITSIQVSINGGPFVNVTSTSPTLPAAAPVNFTAANLPLALGSNTITVRAISGPSQAFDSVSGVMRDTLPPVVVPGTCDDVTVDLGPGCRLDYFGTPNATDICDPTVDFAATPPLPLVFTAPGTRPISYLMWDDSLNTTSCARDVTARDIGPPVIVCPAAKTLECTATGGLPDSDPDVRAWIDSATVSDNCTLNPPLTHNAPVFFSAGCVPGKGTTVVWESEDEAMNRATCNSTLSVEDSTPPEILATPPPLTLECNVPGGVNGDDPDVLNWVALFQASDRCFTNAVLDDDVPALVPSGCTPGRVTPVTFGATDDCGNRATEVQELTIVDTTAPTLTTPLPLELECNTAGGVLKTDPAVQAWLSSAISSDICGSVAITDDAPALLPSGCGPGFTTTVTFTATDDCGNLTTATSTITVKDTSKPDLAVPAPLQLECNAAGGVPSTDAAVRAWLALAVATDICSGLTITNDAPALLPSGCGPGFTTTVTFTATDDCGNRIAKSSVITVVDTTAPVLTVPTAIVLECNGAGGVPRNDPQIIAWLATAAATDVCDGATITDDAPARFASGCGTGFTTTVTFDAVDNCGNLTRRTATVTVRDTTAPVLTPPATLNLECNGPNGVPLTDPAVQAWLRTALATDVCDGATITHDAPALFLSACGVGADTTVTFEAVDNCGNLSRATAIVNVRDTTAPVVTVPAALPLECNVPGGVRGDDPAVLAWLALAAASDVCDGATLTNDAPNFFPSACTPGRETVVTFSAVDNCANQAQTPSAVTVVDTTAPSLNVPAPLALECNSPGGVPATDPRVVAWLAAANGSDICDGVTITDNAPALFPSGCGVGSTTTVTFTAVDNCGNATVKSSTITVVDTTAPNLTVPAPLELECNSSGGIPGSDPRIVAWLAAATATDICDKPTITNDAPAFFPSGCLPGSSTTVTFTATDNCGNASLLTSTITVADTTPPDVSGLMRPLPPLASSSAKPPKQPAAPRSVCSPPTSRSFVIECQASDVCDPTPTLRAVLRVTNHDVPGPGSCAVRIDDIDVGCGEEVIVHLVSPPCPAKGPRSPRAPVAVISGKKVITGELVVLEVEATDNCGNQAVATYDPTKEPSPLCDEVLADGTCCPAIGFPPDEDCKVPLCGRCQPGVSPPPVARSVTGVASACDQSLATALALDDAARFCTGAASPLCGGGCVNGGCTETATARGKKETSVRCDKIARTDCKDLKGYRCEVTGSVECGCDCK